MKARIKLIFAFEFFAALAPLRDAFIVNSGAFKDGSFKRILLRSSEQKNNGRRTNNNRGSS